jgi:hypothetical protein
MWKNNSQKGSAIFFAVIAMAVILAIAFGVNTLVFRGFRSTQGDGNSIIAFYAAEAGIDHLLFFDKDTPCSGVVPGCLDTFPSGAFTLSNGATYQVAVYASGTVNCPDPPAGKAVLYCVQSTGTFEGVSRKIEIER